MILGEEYKKAKKIVEEYESAQLNKPAVLGSGTVAICGIHNEPMYLNRIGQWECIKCHC